MTDVDADKSFSQQKNKDAIEKSTTPICSEDGISRLNGVHLFEMHLSQQSVFFNKL